MENRNDTETESSDPHVWPPTAHLLKWLSKVPTSSPMRLSWAGTMPCRHTTRSLLSLVWNTTSWSFPGETLTPVTWDSAREAEKKRGDG